MPADADRNLLFGLLALQNAMIMLTSSLPRSGLDRDARAPRLPTTWSTRGP